MDVAVFQLHLPELSRDTAHLIYPSFFFHFVIYFFFVSFNTYFKIRLLYSDALSVEDYKYGSKLEHQTKNNNQTYYILVITTKNSNR